MTLLLPYEVWRDVVGFEGLYQVSARGRVKSMKRMTPSVSHGKYMEFEVPEKILKYRLNDAGYPIVTLRINGKSIIDRVHRLLAKAFIPNPNNNLEVNHKNGIKTDCDPKNLEWCTHMENMQHAWGTGLINRDKHRMASMRNMRRCFSKKVINTKTKVIYPSATFVAKMNGINPDTLTCRIRNKKCEYRYL